ncbi:hypothetical protein SAMN05216167_108189 [Spirosoma endophyticum]|uniref:Uncharacterized protein n=1 Tax=Spirosoma endophyticum TaxID=662367 RepID=A0A1I1WFC4_9BACT|nr:hypothetical protein SAMN05216167_108189 [Spirosoma endophyticum]
MINRGTPPLSDGNLIFNHLVSIVYTLVLCLNFRLYVAEQRVLPGAVI